MNFFLHRTLRFIRDIRNNRSVRQSSLGAQLFWQINAVRSSPTRPLQEKPTCHMESMWGFPSSNWMRMASWGSMTRQQIFSEDVDILPELPH